MRLVLSPDLGMGYGLRIPRSRRSALQRHHHCRSTEESWSMATEHYSGTGHHLGHLPDCGGDPTGDAIE